MLAEADETKILTATS